MTVLELWQKTSAHHWCIFFGWLGGFLFFYVFSTIFYEGKKHIITNLAISIVWPAIFVLIIILDTQDYISYKVRYSLIPFIKHIISYKKPA